MSFNYQDCTVEELADHVEVATPQIISTMLKYYQNKRNVEMVNKIGEARRIVKKRRLVRQLETMQ